MHTVYCINVSVCWFVPFTPFCSTLRLICFCSMFFSPSVKSWSYREWAFWPRWKGNLGIIAGRYSWLVTMVTRCEELGVSSLSPHPMDSTDFPAFCWYLWLLLVLHSKLLMFWLYELYCLIAFSESTFVLCRICGACIQQLGHTYLIMQLTYPAGTFLSTTCPFIFHLLIKNTPKLCEQISTVTFWLLSSIL